MTTPNPGRLVMLLNIRMPSNRNDRNKSSPANGQMVQLVTPLQAVLITQDQDQDVMAMIILCHLVPIPQFQQACSSSSNSMLYIIFLDSS
jgi:hypothetical protein